MLSELGILGGEGAWKSLEEIMNDRARMSGGKGRLTVLLMVYCISHCQNIPFSSLWMEDNTWPSFSLLSLGLVPL